MSRPDVSRDFLSAYGVAAIVILVLVVLSWQFGFVRPSVLAKTTCNFGEDVACSQVAMTGSVDGSTAILTVVLTNDGASTIDYNFNDARAQAAVFGAGPCSAVESPMPVVSLAPKGSFQFTCLLSGQFPKAGEKVRLYVDAAVRPKGNPYWQPLHAEIIQPMS